MQVQEEHVLFEAIDAYKNGNGEKATYIYEATKKYAYSIIYQQVSGFKRYMHKIGCVRNSIRPSG